MREGLTRAMCERRVNWSYAWGMGIFFMGYPRSSILRTAFDSLDDCLMTSRTVPDSAVGKNATKRRTASSDGVRNGGEEGRWKGEMGRRKNHNSSLTMYNIVM